MTQLDLSVEFATNPEPRCACVLLLDVSGSMSGKPIAALNEGLRAFATDLATDALASQRVEVSIVTFGGAGVKVEQDFVTASGFEPPTLASSGGTPMGAAIEQALTMVDQRKVQYRENGIVYYRPWVFLITDGEPTDSWENAAAAVRRAEEANGLAFFAVGVEGANFDVLSKIAVRQPLKLQGLQFVELFVWLSRSQRAVSTSKPGDQTALPTVDGWAVV
ncbi:MAG TPA: VWA domain-containing protein [Acidimicrobiales bacterium]|nr:VWA domain-containing protein [Acidimicrobiales bacterium]